MLRAIARAPGGARASRTRRTAPAALTLALLALAVFAPATVSAAIVRLPGRTLSTTPLRNTPPRTLDEYFSNVDYNGGPVMPSSTTYAVYWAPTGSPAYPSDYQPGIDRYFEDIAHDSGNVQNVQSVSAQYDDAAGDFARYESHFGGAVIDTQPYPANGCKQATICLSDAQLRVELKRLVAAEHLPADLTHEYFMLTPPGVEDCLSSVFCSAGSKAPEYCAYHGDVATKGGGVIVYASDPYDAGNNACDTPNYPNGSTSDGELQGGLSHEYNESLTDPEPDSAWADFSGAGGEVGDKCRTFVEGSEFGTPLGRAANGAYYNQLINGDEYWYQQEWSNQGDGCLQRLNFAGAEPTATFTTTALAGTEVRLDASGSTAPGGVFRYSWQFNDGPGPVAPVETSEPTLTHAFGATGYYDVALTVYASDGTSIGTARFVAAGNPPAPRVLKLMPNRGPAAGGGTVLITGSNIGGATSVTFGGAAASFSAESPTSLLATVPAHAPGTAEVIVTTPSGTSAPTLADVFHYVPSVASVSPASGSHLGGAHVTITGSGFAAGAGATVFHFGTAKASGVVCASSTSCTATTPAHETGVVAVKATAAKLSSVSEPPGDEYTYD